jgi:hypothetical protein
VHALDFVIASSLPLYLYLNLLYSDSIHTFVPSASQTELESTQTLADGLQIIDLKVRSCCM